MIKLDCDMLHLINLYDIDLNLIEELLLERRKENRVYQIKDKKILEMFKISPEIKESHQIDRILDGIKEARSRSRLDNGND